MRELSLHVLDLLENALEAGASRVELEIDENLAADRLTIVVRDNGRGMDGDTARRALDPFFTTRTTRHVGLGLPLLAAAAERCDGAVTLDSAPGQGTTVSAMFRLSHIDRAPLGNLPDTLLAFLMGRIGQAKDPRLCEERGDEAALPEQGDRPIAADDGTPQLVYRHRLGGQVFELDTAAIQAELGEVPLSYPPVRDWLQGYLSQGEAGLMANDGSRRADG